MRLLTLLPLLLLPLPAAAGTSLDKYIGDVDEVEIGAQTEVELLVDRDDPHIPLVAVTVNGATDQPNALFAISSGDSVITVTDSFAARFGLEVKKKKNKWAGEEEFSYVEIDSLQIGDLILRDVTALVSSSKVENVSGFHPQQIGMGLLPQVAYAIVPSEGVVRFAPAADGGSLLQQVGGVTLPYEDREADIVKVGEDKERVPDWNTVVQVKVGNADVQAKVDTASAGSRIKAPLDRGALTTSIGATAVHQDGDVFQHWAEVSFGSLGPTEGWVSSTTIPEDLPELGYLPRSYIGANILAFYDIAVDPATRTVAIDLAPANNRKDALPGSLSAAIHLAEEADRKAAEAAAAKDPPEEPKPDASAWTKVAMLYEEAGQLDKAIETWSKVVAADEKSCSAWQGLGNAQVRAFQLQEATAALLRASELYHGWWDDSTVPIPGPEVRPFFQRLFHPARFKPKYEQTPYKNLTGQWIPALARTFWTEMQAEGKELPEGVNPQASSCWTADSTLASVYLATGQAEQALALYERWMENYPPLRMVLDPTLAVVGGNVNLSEGRWDASYEHLRLAAERDFSKEDPRWALGLALAYSAQEKWESARPLFQEAMTRAPDDAMIVGLYLDAVQRFEGEAAAVNAARGWAGQRPDSAAALYGLARMASAGGEQQVSAVKTEAAPVFQRLLGLRPRDAQLWANYARYLVEVGDLAQATEAANAALQLDPAQPAAFIALADIAGAGGDTARSTELARKAGQAAADHPGYALVLGATNGG